MIRYFNKRQKYAYLLLLSNYYLQNSTLQPLFNFKLKEVPGSFLTTVFFEFLFPGTILKIQIQCRQIDLKAAVSSKKNPDKQYAIRI